LSSVDAIKDLLEKRGSVYSDRPVMPLLEMMEWEWHLPIAGYGEAWRQGRKLLDRSMRPGAAAMYRSLQQARVRVLLTRILAAPDQWRDHIDLFQGGLILDMTYGYEVKGPQDRKLVVPKQLSKFSSTKVPRSAWILNGFPFLRHVPAWVPYLSFEPVAEIGRTLSKEMLFEPMRFVKESIIGGTARPSLALEHLQEIEKMSESDRGQAEKILTGALGSIYIAGADTTTTSIMTFLIACMVHPEVQKKARDQIDAVVGRERLPSFEDRPSLPFVDAMYKEVLRWRPLLPLAVPHAASEDGVYEGFFIPKGTLVSGNTWAIFRDPSIYPEPEAFKPERFINSDGSFRDDPLLSSAFGFGKRICPGRHIVDNTMFIFVASVLSVFRIEKAPGDQGEYKYTSSGSVSRPELFSCSITPRDKRAEELIIADTMAR